MEKKKEMSLFKVVKVLLPMIYKSGPIVFIIFSILGIFSGISYGINTIIIQKFFDNINSAVKGVGTVKSVILMAVALGSIILITELANGLYNYMGGVFGGKFIGYLYKKFNEKAGKLEPVLFEDAEILDSINKAQKGIYGSNGIVITIMSLVSFNFPYFIFMTVYLLLLDKVLVFAMIFIFLPPILTQVMRVKLFQNLENEVAPIRREYEYYEKAICDREYFKETRILGAFSYFIELYKDAMKLLSQKIWSAEKKNGVLELGMKSITLFGYLGVLCLLFYSLFKRNITIGAFSAVFTSISTMISMMNTIVSLKIGRITRNIGMVRNFIAFFNMSERGGKDININGDDSIYLKNVVFSYPSAKSIAIKGVNLEIKPKETIAIVGENGAGKSTLVRLITGLYLPTEGQVLFGDVDTRNISPRSLYKNTTGVFQNYQRYKMKLKENVMISNGKLKSEEQLELAMDKADLSVESSNFPKGYDTMLSREFDGVDLSGGQWQRVAIARGFYKSHNMIVLDEPTAAIDPIEETKLYERFTDISKDKTAIIVTHRLGSVKIADRIIVMDKGDIAEVGTHEELMAMKGKYAEMYEAQAKWYVREEVVS